MKEKLRNTLACDMNIFKFADETEREYNQRLIYSAGAAWTKTLVFGNSYTDKEENKSYINVDIMYIQTHLSKVLEAFLKCFDIDMNWIEVEGKENIEEKAMALAGQIVQEVIYTYNLAQIQSRRVVTLKTKCFKHGKDLYLVRGETPRNKTTFSVGVAQWLKSNEIVGFEVAKKIVDVKGEDYYQIIDSTFPWRRVELKSEYLIFETGSSKPYSKCWKPVDFDNLPKGISILKLADEYNGGYVLVKNTTNDLQMVELDPWYKEEMEIYRILYALNYKNQTPALFHVYRKKDFYILRCRGAVPNHEDRIIRCCSWPYKSYKNKYFRIIPEFLWCIVEKAISELGIKIIYQ